MDEISFRIINDNSCDKKISIFTQKEIRFNEFHQVPN